MRVFWTNTKDLSNSMAETNLVFLKLECNFVKVSMKPYFGAELENKKLKGKIKQPYTYSHCHENEANYGTNYVSYSMSSERTCINCVNAKQH